MSSQMLACNCILDDNAWLLVHFHFHKYYAGDVLGAFEYLEGCLPLNIHYNNHLGLDTWIKLSLYKKLDVISLC